VGWANRQFLQNFSSEPIQEGKCYIGSDSLSWGLEINFPNLALRHNNSSTKFEEKIEIGDVLGCAFDVDNKCVYYAINGIWNEKSSIFYFERIYSLTFLGCTPVFSSCQTSDGILPIISFVGQCHFRLNIGDLPFYYEPPTNFSSIFSWISVTREHLYATTNAKVQKKFPQKSLGPT
jgi:hypothetical protein